MITQEVNITELSKMLGKEYDKYEDRIFKLETALFEIKTFINSILSQKNINRFTEFECKQILNIINQKIGNK